MVKVLKKRKLKGFVLPSIYLIITIGIFTGIILLGSSYNLKTKDYKYGVSVLKDNVKTVIVEDTIAGSTIISPVKEGEAGVVTHFYHKDEDQRMQESSLIYYENTYLPNTGLLYASDKSFEVLNVFAGKVTNIAEDEFFGKYIVVEHANNLVTYYYGLEEIKVNIGDEIENKTILGSSKNNEIMNDKKTFLLEAYHNNELINPEELIGKKITDYE